MAKERNSIVELFWLISMWCVFAHHFVIHNADDISVFASPLTRLIFKGVFLPIGKVAVGGSVEKVGVRALAAPVSDIRNQLIS